MDEEMRLQAIVNDPYARDQDAINEASQALYVLRLRQGLNRSSPTAINQVSDLNSQLAVARQKMSRFRPALDRLDRLYRLLEAGIPVQIKDSYDVLGVDRLTKQEITETFTVGQDGDYGNSVTTIDEARVKGTTPQEQAKAYIAENLRKLLAARSAVRQQSSNLAGGIAGLEIKIKNLGFKVEPDYKAPGMHPAAEAAYQGGSKASASLNRVGSAKKNKTLGFNPAPIPTVEAEDLQSLEEGDTASFVPIVNKGSKKAKSKVSKAIKNAQPAKSNALAAPKPPVNKKPAPVSKLKKKNR